MKNRQGDERHRIVVGVDGFESSKAALRWAIRQAKLTGAVVEAVIAWHIPVGTGWIPTPDMPDYQEDAFTVLAEALLGSVGQYCANNASCPVVVMRGKREG
jgi:nucleotide-binding universal stress UspA family protein